MANQKPNSFFDQKNAPAYNQSFSKLEPLRDAIHLLMRVILSELSTNAHILCVGAGTGAELIYLAQSFPEWHFTAVEPAAPMLDICRQRTEDLGIASRCTFHQGYLDSLPTSDAFDAATCLLVSHFMQPNDQNNLFGQIAKRLCPRGYLVSSALAYDMSTSEYQSLLEVWLRMLDYSEISAEQVEKIRASFGRDVALLPLKDIESMLESSGFDSPVLFYQTLLIHAWYVRRSP